MDINNPGSTRPFWYDRTPVIINEFGNLSDSAVTTEDIAEYVCPANKKAIIQGIDVFSMVSAVTTPGFIVWLLFYFNDGGGYANRYYDRFAPQLLNDRMEIPDLGEFTLTEGCGVKCILQIEGSGTMTMGTQGFIHGIEFDA